MASREKALGLSLVVSASLLWGSESVATIFAVSGGFNPYTLALYVLMVDFIILLPIWLAKRSAPWSKGLLLFGLLACGSFRIAFAYSIIINGAGVAAALVHVAPLIVSFASPVVFKTRFDSVSVLLAFVAVLGAYITSNPELKLATATGFLVGIIPAIMYAAQVIISKYYHDRGFNTVDIIFQPLPTAFVAPLIAALLFSTPIISIDLNGLLWATYISVVCSTAALLLYIEGLKYVSATAASIIALLEPVSALALASTILGETYTKIQLAGITTILTAALVTSLRELR
ncbi:MAG: EamA family transporter [Desulfurococcales archaeon]|nr:EamA family transporter [Desulfurococcales archaeon]